MKITVHGSGDLICDEHHFRCAVGRGGVGTKTGEGDGITPIGQYALRTVYFRPDRIITPKTGLPVIALTPTDGWCDDPAHRHYNHKISLPFTARHEQMWRDDGLYDVVVVIGYNDHPVVPALGSAIFMHVARPEYDTTEGCVALSRNDLLTVLERCGPGSLIDIIPAER